MKQCFWNIFKKNTAKLLNSYNPQKSNVKKHLGAVEKNLDSYSWKHENFVLLRDFNVEPTEAAMGEFVKVYFLTNLVKGSSCIKNPDRPSWINLILTSKSKSFQTSQIIKNVMPDFHKMVMTVLKVYFKIEGPSSIQYQDYNDLLNKMIKS